MSAADIIAGNEFPYQDYIMLGGAPSPGRATILGGGSGSPRTWDVRKGYGYSGAFIVYTGDGLAKFKVMIELWLPEHFAAWQRFAKITLSKPPLGLKPTALDIAHPILNMQPWSITSVVVEDVSPWEQDEEGMWSTTIDFLQFRGPKPMLGKPLASIPNAVKKIPTAQDAAEVEIQKLMTQFNSLANGP
jgi:hypothetical protein